MAGPLTPIVGIKSTFLEPFRPFPVPGAAAGPAQVWLPDSPRHRLVAPPPRRAVVFSPPVAVAAAPIATARRPRPLLALQRRQRGSQPLQQPVSAPSQVVVESRRRLALPQRGRQFQPPWTPPAQVAPPQLPPVFLRGRRYLAPGHRPRGAEPSWPQAVQIAPPTMLPTYVRSRRYLAWMRRGRTTDAWWSAPSVPPASWVRRRPVVLSWRRGRSTMPPAAPQAASQPLQARRWRWAPPPRRGRPAQPSWPQALQVPPPLLVDRSRRARFLLPLWPRRARFSVVVRFQPATALRDVDLIVYVPFGRWVMGPVAVRWRVGSPFGRWATGIIASRWRAQSPFSRWGSGPPESGS